jgi:hypothetical protein
VITGAALSAVAGAPGAEVVLVEAEVVSGFSAGRAGAFEETELVAGAAVGALVSVDAEAAWVTEDAFVAAETVLVGLDAEGVAGVAGGGCMLWPASSTAMERAAGER